MVIGRSKGDSLGPWKILIVENILKSIGQQEMETHKKRKRYKIPFCKFYESIKIFFLFFTSGQMMTNVFYEERKKRKRAAAVHFKFGKNGGIFLLFETEDKRIGLLVAFLAHHKSLLLVLVAATVGVVAISRNPHFCCTQKNSATRVVLRRRKITGLTQVKEGPCFKSERWFASENVFFFQIIDSDEKRKFRNESFVPQKKIADWKRLTSNRKKKWLTEILRRFFFFEAETKKRKKNSRNRKLRDALNNGALGLISKLHGWQISKM